jgi:squalene-hopene/tetraprenyl-beta-curcumene cyclase
MSGALDRTIATLAERLLDRRVAAGHWEGRLSSSALSTATAVIALSLGARSVVGAGHEALVRAGLDWLAANQNDDGGWGDTPASPSNLSTTALVWAALAVDSRPAAGAGQAAARAEAWLRGRAGDLSPASLKTAIIARYGRDRTFSAPILAALAVAGRLGEGAETWRMVPQLPFELAACPHRWFQFLRLPVVSYALPALVAIGLVRHQHAPSRNPLAAALRDGLRARTLRVAGRMQPASGGYLEAVPLTAFVAMSLIAAGEAGDPVVAGGLRFLAGSVRPDGSWPIDTNLSTWVTTLSIDALRCVPPELGGAERHEPVLRWLLAQQARAEHPFTRAKPGGWAWTDLAGGVPDADDTAGALRAIRTIAAAPAGGGRAGPGELEAAETGIRWLLDLQNRDGGIPTFCRGWGALPFDRSAPDLAAHALEAWSAWRGIVSRRLGHEIDRAARRAVAYLVRGQAADGSWLPLWFGNQHVSGESNPAFGTARVAAALATPLAAALPGAADARKRGVDWLLAAQQPDGGWGGASGAPSSIEETGLVLHALAVQDEAPALASPLARGARWLIEATGEGRRTPASPIGLYFARLWYDEELYPLIFALRGLAAVRRWVGLRADATRFEAP